MLLQNTGKYDEIAPDIGSSGAETGRNAADLQMALGHVSPSLSEFFALGLSKEGAGAVGSLDPSASVAASLGLR